MSNHPRTSPNQKVPSRNAKAKHSLKSKLSSYGSGRGDAHAHFADYLTKTFPETSIEDRKRWTDVLMYAYNSGKPIPSPNDMRLMFEIKEEECSTTQ